MSSRLTIEEMQDIALDQGGWCLSGEYKNSKTKIWWQCGEGHIWKATPEKIKYGRWCPYCSGNIKHTLEDMQELAKTRGGLCLSDTYVNARTKLRWQCKEGHVWEAVPHHIDRGIWCPQCAIEKRAESKRLTIEEMQEIAKERGGKCLSDKYVDANTKLKWQCSVGHIFWMMPSDVKQDRWCPRCYTPSLGERISREYFEIIFKKEFPTKKPRWLLNNHGYKMELDGYCKDLKLAFEYNGRQHYEPIGFFYTDGFHQRKEDDALKEKICEEKGIKLIIIPYKVNYEDIQNFIIDRCKENGIDLPEKIEAVNYKKLNVYRLNKIQEMKDLAKSRKGECLSDVYVNNRTKLKWKCEKGHIWKATPDNISRGKWCPDCGGTKKLTIQDMQIIARKMGGRCLSKEYLNNRTKLTWQCSEGHIWDAIPSNVKKGHWCPYCAGKAKLTIEEMQNIAEKKAGLCLSDKYINAKTKLTWQCEKGHQWEAIPDTVKRGSWCPHCGGSQKHTIVDMNRFAEIKNGKFLSKEYVNAHTKHKWECKEGHIFWMRPNDVQQGQWCPECYKISRRKPKKYNRNFHKNTSEN